VAKKKPETDKQNDDLNVSRRRVDVLSVTFTQESLQELDKCVDELSRLNPEMGSFTRSAALRYAVCALHDRLFWRDLDNIASKIGGKR